MPPVFDVCGVQLSDCRQSVFGRDVGKNGNYLDLDGFSIKAIRSDGGHGCLIVGAGQIKNRR